MRDAFPGMNFNDGLEVVEMLMTAYMSAERGRTLDWKPAGLDTFIPAVAKGTCEPGRQTPQGWLPHSHPGLILVLPP